MALTVRFLWVLDKRSAVGRVQLGGRVRDQGQTHTQEEEGVSLNIYVDVMIYYIGIMLIIKYYDYIINWLYFMQSALKLRPAYRSLLKTIRKLAASDATLAQTMKQSIAHHRHTLRSSSASSLPIIQALG